MSAMCWLTAGMPQYDLNLFSASPDGVASWPNPNPLLEAAGVELIPPKGFMAGPPWGVAGLLSPKPAKPEARLAGGAAALLVPPPDAPPAGHMQGPVSSLPN